MMDGPRPPPVFKPEVPGLDEDNRKEMGIVVFTSASSSREEATSASTSRLQNSNEKGAEPVNSLTLNNKGKKSIASSSSSHGSSKVVRFLLSYLSLLDTITCSGTSTCHETCPIQSPNGQKRRQDTN